MNKETYNERKSKGLCPLCGSSADDGYVTCKTCRTIQQKKKEARRVLGLCVNCNKPTNRDVNLCEECSKKAAETKRKQREKRAELGLCNRCGGKVEEGYMQCKKCREYSLELRQTYIQYGLCSYCHKQPIMGDERTCPECRVERRKINTKYRKLHKDEIRVRQNELHKIRYEKRKEEGLCTRCGKRKATDGKFTCRMCRGKNAQEKRLQYVKILIDRPNRCRYCNNDSAPGYKVCEEHRQKLSISATSRSVNEARKKMRARLKW